MNGSKEVLRALREEVVGSAFARLLEIPTPNLRAVAVDWTSAIITLRLFYAEPPSELEIQLGHEYGTYVVADFVVHGH